MNPKTDFIAAYFEEWEKKLAKAKGLLNNSEYYLEGILVLSCYIGAFSRLRFSLEDRDWKAYKRIVLEYSGMREFYENVDLLFFYQWPRSLYKDDNVYNKLKKYYELLKVFTKEFGDESVIKTKNSLRYIPVADLLNAINANPFSGFDKNNFQEYIKLFNLSQILYQYVRCQAVHVYDFPLMNKVSNINGAVRYDDNHAITGKVIYETVSGILSNLKSECLSKNKWPYELT